MEPLEVVQWLMAFASCAYGVALVVQREYVLGIVLILFAFLIGPGAAMLYARP